MPTLTLAGDGQTFDYALTAGEVAPLDAYEQWATEIGVSPTATLQALDGDDVALAITLDQPLFEGWSSAAMFSSEAAIGLHSVAPTNTARGTYTLPNISRMFGFNSRPKLLFTFHPQADLKSYGTRLQRANGVTIIFARFSTYNNESTFRYDAAIRIDRGTMRFVGRAYDQPANLYFNELQESLSTTLVAQTLIGTTAAGSTVTLTATAAPAGRAYVDGVMSASYAQANYGEFDRTGTVTLGSIFDGALLSQGQVYSSGLASVSGVLGSVESRGNSVSLASISTPSFMGATLSTGLAYAAGYVSTPSMLLQFVRVRAAHDYSAQIGRTDSRYLVNLITPEGEVRVPISSWQATLQLDALNYVQCVVPAAGDHVAAINAATEFVVLRTAVSDGVSLTQEMARTQITQARFDRGPYKYTCTLSGYSPGFVLDEQPAITDRALENIRSITSGQGGLRARCAVDWLLRPGQRASIEGAMVTVAYINYYVGQGDAYMDVGERVA